MTDPSGSWTGGFDLQKQREALEELRKEVEALEESAPASCSVGDPGASPGADSRPQRDAQDDGLELSPGRLSLSGAQPDVAQREMEAQWKSLATELAVAEARLSEVENTRASAKAEWARSLRRSAGSQARQEKRLTEMQSELESLRAEEAQHESKFRSEREKLQQRLRRVISVKETVAYPAPTPKASTVDNNTVPKARSSTRSSSVPAVRPPRPSTGRSVGSSKRADARLPMRVTIGDAQELRRREEQLCQTQEELQARQAELKQSAHLSDSELARIRTRSDLRAEETAVREEQAEVRLELKAVEANANTARRELVRLRNVQQTALKELTSRNDAFKRQAATETEAMQLIDAYLASAGSATNREVHDRLAEWLEADIGLRQVEHVKRTLSTIVADTGARAQVLEKALAELHEDLDRRAAVILELVDRLQALRLSALSGPYTAAAASGDSNGVERDTGGQADQEGHSGEPESEGAGRSSSSSLEVKAVEAELRNQRGLFEVRSEQVEVLEQRLATLLAKEAPKAQALRQWIAVHEPFSEQRLETCMAAAIGHTSLRADIEAMRSDKASEFAQAEAAREEECARLAEVTNSTKDGADAAAQSLLSFQRQREKVLHDLDRLLKLEHMLMGRSATVQEVIDKDRRRLIEQTAQQLRAAAKSTPGPRKVRSQIDIAAEARSIVEATRTQQVTALDAVTTELAKVTAELHQVQAGLAHLKEKQEKHDQEQESKTPRRTTHAAQSAASSCRQASSASKANSGHPKEKSRAELVRQAEQNELRREELASELKERMVALEQQFEETAARDKERRDKAAMQVEELQSALKAEQGKHRASSSSVLKDYRGAHAAVVEAEKHRDGIKANLASLQSHLLLPRPPSARRTAASSPRPASQDTGTAQGSASKEPRRSSAADGGTGGSHARPLLSLAEVRQRTAGDSELFSFYLTVFPLLKGTSISLWRKPRQRFEPRRVVLSTDLQRLEVWPLGGSLSMPSSGADKTTGRAPRLAENFVRVESVARVHVPKGTLLAVQQMVMNGASFPAATDAHEEDGSDVVESPEGLNTQGNEAARNNATTYPFDLILASGEPWRFAAPDAQTFHLLTAALGVWLSSRASLLVFSNALGLGSTSPRSAA